MYLFAPTDVHFVLPDGKDKALRLIARPIAFAAHGDGAERIVRGGAIEFLALDGHDFEQRFSREAVCEQTPEMAFEKRWAETVLENSLRRLRFEFDGGGKVRRFDILKPFLLRQKEASYREAGEKLGMSEAAVKKFAQRMRKRFGDELRRLVKATVVDDGAVSDEIQDLFRAFQK